MKNGEDILKEMLGKRPDELEGETLKLFEAIMKIADERDELKVRNKELEEELNSVKEIYYTQKDIETDYIPKSKVKEKIEEYTNSILENLDEDRRWCDIELVDNFEALKKELLEE